MAYTEDQKYWIWLGSVYGLGPKRFDALLTHVGRPQQVWEEFGPHMLPHLGTRAYEAVRQARNAAYLDGLFVALGRTGAVAVTRQDVEYPARLQTIADAPPVLFVLGRAALGDAYAVSIVGARNATAYGTRMARRIARELSRAGVTVVSGLARGVDSAAHRGAVDVGARTVAVLGSGVDVLYPPEHRMLAEEILARGGSIISEQPPGAPPKPHHFPARNRIISGMSGALLLVEAAKRSGAMSTVSFAAEQGREVFVLPGQADSALSTMPHALARDGARLVTCGREILEDMGWSPVPSGMEGRDAVTGVALPLTRQEQRAYDLLRGGAMDTDALVSALDIPPQELSVMLTMMELQGIVRKLPGRKIELTEREADGV